MLRKNFRATVLEPGNHMDGSPDFNTIAERRVAIFTTVNGWLMDGGGIMDLLDQPELYNEVDTWLHNQKEHAMPFEVANNIMLQPVWKELDDTRLNLLSIFESQTKRPSLRHAVSYDPGVYGTSTQSYGKQLPDVDHMNAWELVEQLDAIGSVAIRGLQSEVSRTNCLKTILIHCTGSSCLSRTSGNPIQGQNRMDSSNGSTDIIARRNDYSEYLFPSYIG
jgi:hypothetical protein